ncbi:hypothetical protein [Microvirga sp. M2]|uniref:hypothetical protein n=1 Tax=Microvirga sp. M2 TaxID=3073270 RepID=UPI0039C140AD
MAVHVIDHPLPPTSNGHALTIGSGDTVIVTEAGELAAQNLGWCGIDGISVGNGGLGAVGTNLIINGRVSSADFYGIATNGSITVGQTGAVSGRFAIYLVNDHRHGTPDSLVNLGSVTGRDYGVFTDGSLPGQPFSPVTITNTGTISGEIGIGVGGDLTLINSGLIKGTGGIAIATVPDGLSRKITNTGVIDGDVSLSGGHDLYDGRGGRINGTIYLGDGDDTVYGGAGAETVALGGGHNVFYGGDGIDTLDLSQEGWRGGHSVDLRIVDEQSMSATSWAVIGYVENILGTSANDWFVGSPVNNILRGNSGNDTLFGYLGDDQLFGGGQDDFLDGGSGNDLLDGGSGTDVALFRGRFADYTIQARADGSFLITDNRNRENEGIDTLTGIEYVQFADRTIALAPTNSAPVSVSLSATSVGGNAPAGTVVGTLSGVDPDGDPLGYHLVTNPGGLFRIHGNQLLVAGRFHGETRVEIVVRASDPAGASIDRTFSIDVTTGRVSPVASAQTLKGGKTADILVGGKGHDLLNGGLGCDKLTGLAGQDTFAFTTKLGATNVDRIVDFNHADDTIRLAQAVFGKLQKGILSKAAFWAGAKAHDKSDRIIYNEKTGDLSYDADGSGTKYGAVKFAQVKAGTLLKADDFFVT